MNLNEAKKIKYHWYKPKSWNNLYNQSDKQTVDKRIKLWWLICAIGVYAPNPRLVNLFIHVLDFSLGRVAWRKHANKWRRWAKFYFLKLGPSFYSFNFATRPRWAMFYLLKSASHPLINVSRHFNLLILDYSFGGGRGAKTR
jgi:hypothetical protein